MQTISPAVLEYMLTQTHIGFFLYDVVSEKISYITPYLKDLMDLTEDCSVNAVKKRLNQEDCKYLEDLVIQMKNDAISQRQFIQVRLIGNNGELKVLEAKIAGYYQDNKLTLIGGFVEDITARKDNEEILIKYNSKKNTAIEILSHDIQGPLGLIRTTASLIEDKVSDGGSEKLIGYSQYIQQLSSRTIELVNSINSKEYLETADAGLKISRVNIVERVQYAIDVFRSSSGIIKRNFKLFSSTDSIFAEIDDSKLISIAFINIISNAIKFTHDDGSISVTITDEDGCFQLVVRDNGIGIPEAFAPVLFNKFSEASRPGLRGERSIGLGLSIVKQIVDLHSGNIWYESEVNKGTTFYVKIPKIFQKLGN